MKIVVSGGWSYGNLGDDAILEATSVLLRRHAPSAEIVWTAYDVGLAKDSGIELAGALLPSVHRFLDRTHSFWMLQTVGKCRGYSQWPRFWGKRFRRYVRPLFEAVDAWRDRVEDPSDAFKGADVFLMSGGGYFNRWPSMFRARMRELELAHANGCRTVLLGQSIGPFSSEQHEQLRKTLSRDDRICVRDEESVGELGGLGFSAELAPDLALGVPESVPRIPGLVTVVPGELDPRRVETVVEQLVGLKRTLGDGLRLRLIQTCDIWSDVVSVRAVADGLRKRGVESEMVIPHDYRQLVSAIRGSEWVLSRRMHGMVIGWRSGSRVFSFTTSRKIVGFLRQIGCPDDICAESDWDRLAESFSAAFRREEASGEELRKKLAGDVDAAFRRMITG